MNPEQQEPTQSDKRFWLRIWLTIRKFWLWLWGLTDLPHEAKLLEEYWQSLRTRLLQFEARADKRKDEKNRFLDRLRALLGDERPDRTDGWRKAFAADKLIPQLLDDNEAEVDWMSRMDEARTDWSPKAAKKLEEYDKRWQELRAAHAKTAADGNTVADDKTAEDAETVADGKTVAGAKITADTKTATDGKRALLQELVNESLYQFAILRQEREYRSDTINFSVRLLVVSLVLLFATFWSSDRHFLDSVLSSLWMVALAGWAGASFSWLTSLRASIREKDLEVLKELSRPIYSISRACIGVVAALVLYLALRGGFISGAAFPVLDVAQSEERLTKVAQAFGAIVKVETSCAPAENEKNRDALIASAVENFRAQLVVHIREKDTQQHGQRPSPADRTDGEWLQAAGVQLRERPSGSDANAAALTFCGEPPKTMTISNALLMQQGTLALLLFWSFVAGFSEKLGRAFWTAQGRKLRRRFSRGNYRSGGSARAPVTDRELPLLS